MSTRFAVTERLILRDFEPSDVPLYVDLSADPEIMRYLGGPRPAEDCREELQAISRQYAAIGVGMLAVERRTDGAFLGICGLSYERWYPNDLQIGWRLFKEHWGQGYATEAALVWRDYAFTTLKTERLISMADVPNLRSHRVMERLGMRFDHQAELMDGDERFKASIYALDRASWANLATH